MAAVIEDDEANVGPLRLFLSWPRSALLSPPREPTSQTTISCSQYARQPGSSYPVRRRDLDLMRARRLAAIECLDKKVRAGIVRSARHQTRIACSPASARCCGRRRKSGARDLAGAGDESPRLLPSESSPHPQTSHGSEVQSRF